MKFFHEVAEDVIKAMIVDFADDFEVKYVPHRENNLDQDPDVFDLMLIDTDRDQVLYKYSFNGKTDSIIALLHQIVDDMTIGWEG